MYYKAELCILLKGKFFWILLAGSLAVNLWILVNFLPQAPLVETTARLMAGTEHNSESQTTAKADMEHSPESPISAGASTEYHHVTEENYTALIQAYQDAEPENAQISVHSLIEGALRLSQTPSAHELADALAETYINELQLTEAAAEEARKAYETLEPYILRDRKDGTASALFVPGTNQFFELFSRHLPLACMAESVLAGILLTLLCVNAPYDSRMKEVVYTTKAGRHLNRVKPIAAFSASALFSVAVWGSSFGLAGILFPMRTLWEVKVGSMMMLDAFYPLVCRFSLSLGTYLLLQGVLSVCVALLFSAAACLFVERSHRTVAAFFELGFLCAATAVFTQLFPHSSKWIFLARFNLVDFAMKAGHYFVSGGTSLSVRYYETALVLFWGTLLAAGLLWRGRRWKREDI